MIVEGPDYIDINFIEAPIRRYYGFMTTDDGEKYTWYANYDRDRYTPTEIEKMASELFHQEVLKLEAKESL